MPDLVSTATTSGPAVIDSGDAARNASLDEVRQVLDAVKASDQPRRSFVNVWDEVQANFLVAPLGFFGRSPRPPWGAGLPSMWGTRSILKDPETHFIVESIAGQMSGMLMPPGRDDYISAEPAGFDDPLKARLISRLLMATMEMSDVPTTHLQAIKDALLFGTSVVEIGWETLSRMQMTKVPAFDEVTGLLNGYKFEPQEVVWRDRPGQWLRDIYNCFPDPAGTSINGDMEWFVTRFDINQLKARELASGPNPVFDRAAVEKVIERFENLRSVSLAGDLDPWAKRRFRELVESIQPDKFGRITGFHYWGRSAVPRPDRATNRVITIWGGENVRSRINPYIDGFKPFVELKVNPVAGRFYGLSPAEVVRFLQDATDALLMDFVDAVNASVRGPLLVGRSFGGDYTQLENRRLLDIIKCGDPKAVAPVPIDFTSLSLAAQQLAQRKLTMRQATGADLIPPTTEQVGDRSTAFQFSEVVRLASSRVEMMFAPIERDAYPKIGRMLHSRFRQFLPDEGAVATLAGEPLKVKLEDIDVDADIRFIGSRGIRNKFQRLASQREAIQTLTQNPEIVFLAPDLAVRHLQELEIPDAEQIVRAAQAYLLQKAQQEQQMEMTKKVGTPAKSPTPDEMMRRSLAGQ